MKVSIVAESYSGVETVCAEARACLIALFTWRRELRKQLANRGVMLPNEHGRGRLVGEKPCHVTSVPEHDHAKADDGISLSKMEADSLDFLVAAQMLGHSGDPITALKNWLRVVRSGGHILLVIPDERFTFDSKRPVTPLEHFFRDHKAGPSTLAAEHYRDIAINCMGLTYDAEITFFISKKASRSSIFTHRPSSIPGVPDAANRAGL